MHSFFETRCILTILTINLSATISVLTMNSAHNYTVGETENNQSVPIHPCPSSPLQCRTSQTSYHHEPRATFNGMQPSLKLSCVQALECILLRHLHYWKQARRRARPGYQWQKHDLLKPSTKRDWQRVLCCSASHSAVHLTIRLHCVVLCCNASHSAVHLTIRLHCVVLCCNASHSAVHLTIRLHCVVLCCSVSHSAVHLTIRLHCVVL